ncbi:MAG: HD domain-containing protein [Lachnospiraceae bacterium]|nr:HD domain-containing protein [Lachnospiraceae bacterium]
MVEAAGIERAVKEDLEDALSHGILVSNLAARLARKLGEDEAFCHEMARAGMMHDVGKLRLCEYLYGRSAGTLGIEEMKYMRLHPKLGREILRESGEYSDLVIESVYHHHENYNGSGYPDNLREDKIPYGARILRTCDVFAALVSNRPYRASFDKDTAIKMMIEEVRHFDMKIFLAFLEMAYDEAFAEIEELIQEGNEKRVFADAPIQEEELIKLVQTDASECPV